MKAPFSRYLFRTRNLPPEVISVRPLSRQATRVVIVPTARAPDGLALSSRNVYLTTEQREAAPAVYASLVAARDAWRASADSGAGAPRDELIAAAHATLAKQPVVTAVDYVSVADYEAMGEISHVPASIPGNSPVAVVSIAVRMGHVRLIDNIVLGHSET